MGASEDVTNIYDRIIVSGGLPATEMADLLDDYAHALAEMIREKSDEHDCCACWPLAADLIDPYMREDRDDR